MTVLRVYLLAGLVVHKLIWEILKDRRAIRDGGAAQSASVRAVKAVKLAILGTIILQTMLPEILPITRDAHVLRAVGACLYTVGLVVAIVGRLQLGRNWSDIESAKVDQRQVLVSTGIYRFIRHPIYTGDLLLLFGLELALNSWLVLGVVALVPVVVHRAVREESMLAENLSGYDRYARRTGRFVPFHRSWSK